MRAGIVIFFAAGLIACKPEITANTYHCGPEGLCPPDLACDRSNLETFAFNCTSKAEAKEFSCNTRTTDSEPDNQRSEALDIGELPCGSQIVFDTWGCIDSGSDVDHFTFTLPSACSGNAPRISVRISYPLGAAPLTAILLDSSGSKLVDSEVCTLEGDEGGIERTCTELSNPDAGEYTIAVRTDESGGADCDGTCAFNRYQLTVTAPLN